jgi:hypothetical protein
MTENSASGEVEMEILVANIFLTDGQNSFLIPFLTVTDKITFLILVQARKTFILSQRLSINFHILQ